MSAAAPSVDLRPDHLEIVRDILGRHVPDRKVLAFGSRATWTAKEYSDLDLAILGEEPLPLSVTAAMEDDFSESDLPFKVDLVDWARLDESFRDIVRRDQVTVQSPTRCSESLSIMDGWRILPFGEVAETLPGKYLPAAEYDENGRFTIYGSNSIMGRSIEPLYSGPIIAFARIGSNSGSTMYSSDPCWINNNAAGIRGQEGTDTRFLYYWMQNYDFPSIREGSGQPYISQRTLDSQLVNLPTLSEQRAIAHILGTLDDKIELNLRMNETLEATARAIFKDWFVDFGPVRAKMEGLVSYLPSKIWNLFPDKLNDKGEPCGWSSRTLEDYFELAYGKSLPANQRKPGTVAVYGSGGIVGRHNEALTEGPAIIVGRKGTIGSLYWEDDSAFPIDTVFYVVPRIDSMLFCYQLLAVQSLREMNTDAAVPGLNRNNVYRLEFPCPGAGLIAAFDRIIGVFWKRRADNLRENNTLVSVRGLLLPKLVSGELRVKDVEASLAKVL